MVLTEAVRMAEGNSSPINNILPNMNSVMTAAGIAGTENTRKSSTAGQHSLTSPILGVYEGSTISSSRNKAPIYTRDKRTKFTQRENKKWVRLATVLGYLIAVCIPAIALSVYYIGFWDPRYKEQYEAHLRDKMSVKEHHQTQPQQCCVACDCPGSTTTANREVRHVESIEHAPSKITSSPGVYDDLSEKAAERAYYHNVILGKNYAIYGATADDASAESGIEPHVTATQATEMATSGVHRQSSPSAVSQKGKEVYAGGSRDSKSFENHPTAAAPVV